MKSKRALIVISGRCEGWVHKYSGVFDYGHFFFEGFLRSVLYFVAAESDQRLSR
jgi:hypothetical protein